MREQRTFSITKEVSDEINRLSSKQLRNKGQIVDKLLRKAIWNEIDEIEHLKNVESRLESVENLIKSIYRVDE